MNAQKIAARFVAFAVYLNQNEQPVVLENAGRYARKHWKEYLPYTSRNLADFLTRPREKRPDRKSEKHILAHSSGASVPSWRQA